MARPRVRRSTKNPSVKVSRKQKNPYNISFAGAHPLVRKNWDKNLTLKQNYERMGLISALNGAAGGTEHEAEARAREERELQKAKEEVEWRRIDDVPAKPVEQDSAQEENFDVEVNGPVEVDPRVRQLGSKPGLKRRAAPTRGEASAKSAVVEAMEAEARDIVKLERHASEQEGKVFGDLMRKHGRDYEAMSRDIKLNRYQLSAGQLRKRIERLINKGSKGPSSEA
ncbi:uncharacterized protein SPPG_03531 [Spizellomyces punctatus DAOM BR117]|uniref:Nucleolar protein 16 n=1 Tax=Spizellomyces punctatus (strain DAOM BR117) TaxID=645134 RepID=A0A0L0HL12_SPIPD|nr:uncharacterized protein SPPG_03531 [Spizellomyces punctatus DAOM BR117]KND01738.1 hypothetical protein SPPG_03531 [Spizellomyces punctatus DAOM BR117]|eukprot:XP_016609777.1 hypothetical protein SPPG_03531 [Spizellomyces punctatus DAOM BR117]